MRISSISFARLYLGVHSPMDVKGGLILGFAIALLAKPAELCFAFDRFMLRTPHVGRLGWATYVVSWGPFVCWILLGLLPNHITAREWAILRSFLRLRVCRTRAQGVFLMRFLDGVFPSRGGFAFGLGSTNNSLVLSVELHTMSDCFHGHMAATKASQFTWPCDLLSAG